MVVKVKKFVAYYRVSTKRQGQSGLGLEAQQHTVEQFVAAQQGQLIGSYTEVESGKNSDRGELKKAMAHAKLAKATLVIAKLDRLSRNVAFLSALMETGVDFVACDNPCADRFTVHVLACVAEKEARDISARTTAALGAYKARGGLLGSARAECRGNLSADAQVKGREIAAKVNHQKALEAYAALLPLMNEMRTNGFSYQAIAEHLNGKGIVTVRGHEWSDVQVRLVMLRK